MLPRVGSTPNRCLDRASARAATRQALREFVSPMSARRPSYQTPSRASVEAPPRGAADQSPDPHDSSASEFPPHVSALKYRSARLAPREEMIAALRLASPA